MAGWLRALVALPVPPAPVVDMARRLVTGGAAHVTLDLAALQEVLGPDEALDRLSRALRWMAMDRQLRSFLLVLDGVQGSWARIQDVREGLRRLDGAGKLVLVYLTAAGNRELYLASAASRVLMLPTGEILAGGLSLRLSFVGSLLQRHGVEVETFTAGLYKSAGEPFSRAMPSRSARDAASSLLHDLQEQWAADISEGRGIEPGALSAALLHTPASAEAAREAGLVDDLAYPDQVHGLAEELTGASLRSVSFSAWWRWMELRRLRGRIRGAGPPVAVVHLRGPVVRRAPRGMRGPHIDPSRVCRLLERLRDDRRVKAVLLVVESAGGDALASDLIWRSVSRLGEAKPMAALMRGVAASGGYLVAAPAARLLAAPASITGSIGVLALRPFLGSALSRLGVHTTTVSASASADMHDPSRRLSREERRRLQGMVERFYTGFLERVAEGRRCRVEDVEPHAGGRVWTGRMALERGLIDATGTMEDALDEVFRMAGAEPGGQATPRWEYGAPRVSRLALLSRRLGALVRLMLPWGAPPGLLSRPLSELGPLMESMQGAPAEPRLLTRCQWDLDVR